MQRRNLPMVNLYMGPGVIHVTPPKTAYLDHVEAFYALVKYLVRLRRDGEINNETFESVVKNITASFVEAEVTTRVDRTLEEIISGKLSMENLLEILQ